MNKFLSFILTVTMMTFLSLTVSAQIPNAGFENWTGGNPDGWISNNVPGFIETITQSNNAHSGSYAVRGEVVIASLRGRIVERAGDHVVVDVGGVGYRVFVSAATASGGP